MEICHPRRGPGDRVSGIGDHPGIGDYPGIGAPTENSKCGRWALMHSALEMGRKALAFF